MSKAWTWSATLLVTCLFGVGIGLSLGYAVFSTPEQPVRVAESAAAPETVADTPTDAASPPEASDASTSGEGPEETGTPSTEVNVPSALVPQPAEPEPEPDPIWAARHLFIAVNGQWLADGTRSFLSEIRPGGVALREVNLKNLRQTSALVKEIKNAVGFGGGLGDLPLVAVQHDGGAFQRFGLASSPSARQLGESQDDALARARGLSYGQACVERGIAVTFAPILDIFESGTINPSLESLTFGSDQTVVAKMGLAMTEGLRAGGVIPVVKHFPGYGAATYGPDGLLVVLNKDFGGLAKVMYPFQEAVRRGVQGILVGHVAVPALDKEDPRRPAALSPILVTELLRKRWGFDGAIIADDIALNDMTRSRPLARTAVEALAAGCDAVVILDPDPRRIKEVCRAIERAVETGELSLEQLDRSKQRLDRWQDLLGRSAVREPARQARAAVEAPVRDIPEPVLSKPAVADSARTRAPSPSPAVERNVVSVEAPDVGVEIAEPEKKPEPEVDVPEPETVAERAPEEATSVEKSSSGTRGTVVALPGEKHETVDQTAVPGIALPEAGETDDAATDTTQETVTQEVEAVTEDAQSESMEAQTVASTPPDSVPDAPAAVPDDETGGEDPKQPEPAADEPAETVEVAAANLSAEVPIATVDTEAVAGEVESAEVVSEEPTAELEAPVNEAARSEMQDEPIVLARREEAAQAEPGSVARSSIEHTVQEGELLSEIGQAYGVGVVDLVTWNNLGPEGAVAGTKLTVYLPDEEEAGAPLAAAESSESIEPKPVTVAHLGAVANKVLHTVEPGETLSGVAERFDVTEDEIALWNGLDGRTLQAGAQLTIFPDASTPVKPEASAIRTAVYRVKAGDTLHKIARDHKTTPDILLELNRLKNPDHVWVGQRLKVPAGS